MISLKNQKGKASKNDLLIEKEIFYSLNIYYQEFHDIIDNQVILLDVFSNVLKRILQKNYSGEAIRGRFKRIKDSDMNPVSEVFFQELNSAFINKKLHLRITNDQSIQNMKKFQEDQKEEHEEDFEKLYQQFINDPSIQNLKKFLGDQKEEYEEGFDKLYQQFTNDQSIQNMKKFQEDQKEEYEENFEKYFQIDKDCEEFKIQSEKNIEEMKKNIVGLKQRIEILDQENQLLKNQNQKLKEENQLLKNQNQKLKEENQEMNRKLEKTIEDIKSDPLSFILSEKIKNSEMEQYYAFYNHFKNVISNIPYNKGNRYKNYYLLSQDETLKKIMIIIKIFIEFMHFSVSVHLFGITLFVHCFCYQI